MTMKGESTIQMVSGLGSVYGSMPVPDVMVEGIVKVWRESGACRFSYLYVNDKEMPEIPLFYSEEEKQGEIPLFYSEEER